MNTSLQSDVLSVTLEMGNNPRGEEMSDNGQKPENGTYEEPRGPADYFNELCRSLSIDPDKLTEEEAHALIKKCLED